MSKAVFCIAESETMASSIVTRLKSKGFSDNDISVLFPDKSSTHNFAHEKNTKAPEGTVAGASAGGVVGGTLGLLAGIGLLAIPGVGPFIAAGPIMAALSGIAVGATVGGITGALIGMGIPELEAKRYEGRVKDGNILISVHADDSKEVTDAKEIFESERATDISTSSEATAPGTKDPAPYLPKVTARGMGGEGSMSPGSMTPGVVSPVVVDSGPVVPGVTPGGSKPGYPHDQPLSVRRPNDRGAR